MVFSGRGRKFPSGKNPFESKSQPKLEQTGGAGPEVVGSAWRISDPSSPDSGRRLRPGAFPLSYKPSAVFCLCLLSAFVAGAVFFEAGRRVGRAGAAAEGGLAISVKSETASDAQRGELESALKEMQKGSAPGAKKALLGLLGQKTNLPSLALLAANAALLEGDAAEAQRCAQLSIDRGEAVSDALVLQAIIEAKLATDPEHKPMGSPRIRIESLLQQAIAADASNPRPYFELATLRRFEKRHGEALELLESASNRLGQSDSVMAVELAKELTKLEQLPDAELAEAAPPGNDAQSLLCAAYAAARLGDPAKAAEFVAQARGLTPPKTFGQLLKDPAFAAWRKEPALEKFFPKQKTN